MYATPRFPTILRRARRHNLRFEWIDEDADEKSGTNSAPGGALDQARVLGDRGVVRVPYGSFKRPLVTIEWSPVEPQFEKKYYVAGTGEV